MRVRAEWTSADLGILGVQVCVSRSRRPVLSPTLAIRSAARQEDAPPLDHSIECAYTASFAALCTLLWRSCSFSSSPSLSPYTAKPAEIHTLSISVFNSYFRIGLLSSLLQHCTIDDTLFHAKTRIINYQFRFGFYVPLPCIYSDICHHPSQHHEFDFLK